MPSGARLFFSYNWGMERMGQYFWQKRYWFGEVDTRPVAVFRIAFGLILGPRRYRLGVEITSNKRVGRAGYLSGVRADVVQGFLSFFRVCGFIKEISNRVHHIPLTSNGQSQRSHRKDGRTDRS